ncbi:regulator of sigma D [Sinobacterium caligoides]|uniref:Regulator of sigma D n=1 Tax=Sinobacterium caligoides TaxID=933926 RepID=A0A3N2DQT3_9GAMM|nr:sigma D regulator [Sinobacterium caligoides]ROS01969.1 regulator of sigma D [Sinobacterium caligoides]
MLEKCKSRQERWGGVEVVVADWLLERSQLLVKYCNLSATLSEGLGSASGGKKLKPAAKELEQFCQILMDYICAGHFEVFDLLLGEAEEFADGGVEFAANIYPQLEGTTVKALSFNDQYDGCAGGSLRSQGLQDDLSALGEIMSTRFDLEDNLLEQLHYRHQSQVA